MTLIHVPRPPKSAMDPNRPVNNLLRAQMEHMQDAELKLPVRQQTNIYINAIKTEGEAGEYIRRVTEAIHQAHDAAARKRGRPSSRKKGVIDIAAAADDKHPKRKSRATVRKRTKTKPSKKAKTKRSGAKGGRKA
jgi:hypothetical protein